MGNKIDFESASIPGVFIGKNKTCVITEENFCEHNSMISSLWLKPIVEVIFRK